jgi:C-terminal processing protease CtpA/Prc
MTSTLEMSTVSGTRKRLVATAAVFALALAACGGGDAQAEPTSSVASTTTATAGPATTSTSLSTTTTVSAISDEAAAYLDEALDRMEELSINRDLVDWEQVRDLAFKVAGPASLPRHTYPAIRLALGELDDEHSVFFPPDLAEDFASGPAIFDEPEVAVRDDGLGYVSIGRYLGDIGEQADEYAATVAMRIAESDPAVCGWIVDLRTDSGGNMWPMLGGLSPLLTEGDVGSFVYPDAAVELWTVAGDRVLWDGMVMIDHGPVAATTPRPTAVLIGSLTGSSGEAVAVAFRGQEATTLYGTPTAGKTTANEPVLLSDGAMIALTMSVFTDRDGNSFGIDTPIEPDVSVTGGADALELAALDLMAGETCSG